MAACNDARSLQIKRRAHVSYTMNVESADGRVFRITHETASRMGTIAPLLGTEENVPLPNVAGAQFALILAYDEQRHVPVTKTFKATLDLLRACDYLDYEPLLSILVRRLASYVVLKKKLVFFCARVTCVPQVRRRALARG